MGSTGHEAERAGLRAGPALVLSAIRHLGWWLEWHTRAAATDAARPVGDSIAPAEEPALGDQAL
jgi:hypothetical protein